VTTNRKDNGLRSTASTSCTAEDWTPKTQAKFKCTGYGQENFHRKHSHHLQHTTSKYDDFSTLPRTYFRHI